MVGGKEIEMTQTVLYIQQLGDVWVWLIERCGGSVQDSRFMTSFSTSENAERAARIWAEMHGLTIDRIDFCRPPETTPPAQYPTEPGAPLTWQQAQSRVDAGLGVETLRAESLPGAGWRSTADFYPGPAYYQSWTYRVPAEPCLSVADKTIDRLAHELSFEKQAHATTKTELAAAKDQLLGLKSVVDFKNRKVGALIQDIQVTAQHLATVEIENRELRAKVAVLDKIKGML